MEVDVHVQSGAEALNQRHRASLSCGVVIAGGFNQMTCNGAGDDAQHLAHHRLGRHGDTLGTRMCGRSHGVGT